MTPSRSRPGDVLWSSAAALMVMSMLYGWMTWTMFPRPEARLAELMRLLGMMIALVAGTCTYLVLHHRRLTEPDVPPPEVAEGRTLLHRWRARIEHAKRVESLVPMRTIVPAFAFAIVCTAFVGWGSVYIVCKAVAGGGFLSQHDDRGVSVGFPAGPFVDAHPGPGFALLAGNDGSARLGLGSMEGMMMRNIALTANDPEDDLDPTVHLVNGDVTLHLSVTREGVPTLYTADAEGKVLYRFIAVPEGR